MTSKNYGAIPQFHGEIPLPVNEMMFYMYLPIKLKGSPFSEAFIPQRLKVFLPLIRRVHSREKDLWDRSFVYLTAKHVFVTPDNMANRPGWHCDGFMTEDVNYVWSDCAPTQYCVQKFNLTQDDTLSLKEMEEQVKTKNIITYPDNSLVRIDEQHVHRVTDVPYTGMRTFVKISISDKKYNLLGNTKNYLMDYDWKMYSRDELRNMESGGNGDYV